MVMLEGVLSAALLKPSQQQPQHRAASRDAAQSSPATSKAVHRFFLHFQITNTVIQAVQKGFTDYLVLSLW